MVEKVKRKYRNYLMFSKELVGKTEKETIKLNSGIFSNIFF